MKFLRLNLKLFFLLFLLLVNVFIFYTFYQIKPATLSVAFLDVGQGDAVLVTAPNGQQMLVDGGSNTSVLRELGKVMPFDDRSIDVVVATHADQDHIGGLVEVLKRYEVDLFIHNNTVSDSAIFEELKRLVNEKKIKEEVIISPEKLLLGDGAEFNIIFPDKDTAGWPTNDSSIVGKLIYGDNSFLLTGDSPQKIEKYLAGKYGKFLKADVLKAGHHGSKNSSSEIFIKTVDPAYAVISAGLNNRYGHPATSTVDLLNKYKIKILQTPDEGTIRFESDGVNLITSPGIGMPPSP